MDTGRKGLMFMGDEGCIFLSDTGGIDPKPDAVLAGLDPPDANYIIQEQHVRNFLSCMCSRKQPVSHSEAAHRSHTITHCANICLRLSRPLRLDPSEEQFGADDEANNMLYRTMRAPWRV